MSHEVSDRHVAREYERHGSGEKANQNEKAANEFEYSLHPYEREERRSSSVTPRYRPSLASA
jgi:hypothetical protein